MTYVCSQGSTWDSIALEVLGDEMLYPALMDVNRGFSDYIVFNGGEKLDIPDRFVVDRYFITRPYQTGSNIAIINAPWG